MKFFALKFFVCLFLSLVLLHPVFSQENDFSAGFMAGGNGIDIRGKSYSFWRGTNNDTWGGLGISGGIFCERYLFKNFLAALQIRYIQKGSTYPCWLVINSNQKKEKDTALCRQELLMRSQFLQNIFSMSWQKTRKNRKWKILKIKTCQ